MLACLMQDAWSTPQLNPLHARIGGTTILYGVDDMRNVVHTHTVNKIQSIYTAPDPATGYHQQEAVLYLSHDY